MDKLDMFLVVHIFSFLDQLTQIRMTRICKKFLKLRDYIYKIETTRTMRDTDFRLYKNLKYLKIFNNPFITRKFTKYVNLEELYCHRKTNVYSEMYAETLFPCIYPSLRVLYQYDNLIDNNVLTNLPNLEVLILNKIGGITDNGLNKLSGLKILHLPKHAKISDHGIKNLVNLKELYCNNNITDHGLKKLYLKKLKCFENHFITDEGIKHMMLKYLECGYSHLTDDGIKHMKLKYLDCGYSCFTDEAIYNSNLTELHCGVNTQFTDAGIANQSLKYLYCGGNNNTFTDKQINKLHLIGLKCEYCGYFTDKCLRSKTIHNLSCGNCVNFTNNAVSKLNLFKLSCPKHNGTLTNDCLRGSKYLLCLNNADNFTIDCLNYCQINKCVFSHRCEEANQFMSYGVQCEFIHNHNDNHNNHNDDPRILAIQCFKETLDTQTIHKRGCQVLYKQDYPFILHETWKDK